MQLTPAEHRANSRRRNREWLFQYYSTHPCVDCGESDPVVLVADHIGEKNQNISKLVRDRASIATLEAEMAHCEIRCCNCHARVTASEQGWYCFTRAE